LLKEDLEGESEIGQVNGQTQLFLIHAVLLEGNTYYN